MYKSASRFSQRSTRSDYSLIRVSKKRKGTGKSRKKSRRKVRGKVGAPAGQIVAQRSGSESLNENRPEPSNQLSSRAKQLTKAELERNFIEYQKCKAARLAESQVNIKSEPAADSESAKIRKMLLDYNKWMGRN